MGVSGLKGQLAKFAVVLAITSCASAASARDWYVDIANGNDSNSGTSTQPLRTLSAGVAAAIAGDNVIVRPGRYTDSGATYYSGFNPARSGTSSAPITIRSEPALGAVLVAKDTGSVALGIFQRQYIVVDGFKAEGMLKIHESQNITIQNCDVIYGSTEGSDTSLNWGMALHSSRYSTLRNNWVHNMRSSGNSSHNTAAIMVGFGSSDNLIENNEADAGNGVVFSAFGQKGGDLFRNTWRRNLARNAQAGFLGMGSTTGGLYSQDNVFYQNIIVNSLDAFRLNHNSQRFLIYQNTAYNVNRFLYSAIPAQNIGTRVWNNIVYQSDVAYVREDTTSSDWSAFLAEADYNNFYRVTTMATWNWDRSSYGSLSSWSSNAGFDRNSITTDPQFVDAAQGNFKLQAGSPAKGAGKLENGVRNDLGAYPTGLEVIGVTLGPRPAAPRNVTIR